MSNTRKYQCHCVICRKKIDGAFHYLPDNITDRKDNRHNAWNNSVPGRSGIMNQRINECYVCSDVKRGLNDVEKEMLIKQLLNGAAFPLSNVNDADRERAVQLYNARDFHGLAKLAFIVVPSQCKIKFEMAKAKKAQNDFDNHLWRLHNKNKFRAML